MEGALTSATASTELKDLAAILWASNEKGAIRLHPADAAALARYLGPERIRQEISQDAELAADIQMKGFAAAALMLVAESELVDTGSDAKRRVTESLSTDIPTIKALYQITLDSIALNMTNAPLDPAEELPDLTDPEVAKRYAISSSALILGQAGQQQPPVWNAVQSSASGHAGVLGEMSNLHHPRRAASEYK
ncbi:hypothetical protein TRAPUB_12506 [Trametes pubescens]|uniref:Uncharacterized protein n=1 Tax=Trametes pubescens TaxID=154538 RepID=A0A1M2VTR2_TRAPU|nr:hypothetical protein TRAPUB_12506 [Trametes pubescens]